MAREKPKPNRPDGRFAKNLFLGYNADGTERRKTIYGKTKKELEDKVFEVKRQIASDEYIDKNEILSVWAYKWLKNKEGKSQRTYHMYKENIERYIIPNMGDMILKNIKPFHVQDLINDLNKTPRTAELVRMTLRQMFDWAIASELMAKNPISKRIQMPSKNKPHKRRTTNAEEIGLRAATLSSTERLFVYLCRFAGLRKSEARGVMWSDIDFKNNKLTVNRDIDLDNSIRIFGKSDKARRMIPMSSELVSLLNEHKRSGNMFVVTNRAGGIITDTQYRNMWRRIKYKINIAAGGTGSIDKNKGYQIKIHAIGRDLSAHILRHTYATLLAEAGYAPAEIMYLMGHETAALALELYTHINNKNITSERLDKHEKKTTVVFP